MRRLGPFCHPPSSVVWQRSADLQHKQGRTDCPFGRLSINGARHARPAPIGGVCAKPAPVAVTGRYAAGTLIGIVGYAHAANARRPQSPL